MKQHITVEQFNELGSSAKKNLRKWFKKQANMGDLYFNDMIEVIMCCGDEFYKDDIPLLSIGQMMEFLERHTDQHYSIFRRTVDWKVVYEGQKYGQILGGELCDALWEAVKEVLK